MRGHQEKVENFVANFSKLAPSSRATNKTEIAVPLFSIVPFGCPFVLYSSPNRACHSLLLWGTGVTFHRECHGLGRENIGGHLLGVSSVLSCQGKGISRKQLILS